MPSDEYKVHKPGGLKLKGGDIKKKKKKSSSSKKARDTDDSAVVASGSGRDSGREESPVEAGSSSGVADGKTDAQRRFEEVQRKRLLDKANRAAVKSHKERVAEFNEKLENLSEHYDIPKVGPG